MNMLKITLIACTLSAAAAHAQTTQTAPAAPEQKVAQAHVQRAASADTQGRIAAPAVKAEECVGPVSFCNIYFGS